MKQNALFDIFKTHLSSILITVFGSILTSTLSDMKTDIKALSGHDYTQTEQIQTLFKENIELKERVKDLEKALEDIKIKTYRFIPKEATRTKHLFIMNNGQICLV